MRILIDINCLLMISPKSSKHHWLMKATQLGEVEMVLSTEILNEYDEILSNFYSSEYSILILKALLNLPNIVRLNPIYYQWNLITMDVDDNKFVDANIGSNADWIITNDKHFKELTSIPYPKISVCNLEEFNEILNN